jgi:hypothetical protein
LTQAIRFSHNTNKERILVFVNLFVGITGT